MTLFKLFGKDTNLLQLFSLEINLNYCFGNVFRLLWTYLYLIVNENNFKSGNISYHPAFVAALWLNIVEKEVCTCTDYFIDGHLLHWFWKYFWLHKRSVALLIYIFKGKEQERRKKRGEGRRVSAHEPNIIDEFNKKEITRRLVSWFHFIQCS